MRNQLQGTTVSIKQIDANGLTAGDFYHPRQDLLEDFGQADTLTGQQDQIEECSQLFGAVGHTLLQRLDHLLDFGLGPLSLGDFLPQERDGIA